MSDHSLKRNVFLSVLFLLTATTMFAGSPSARFETRMVWDSSIHRAVLFGGSTSVDAGTKLAYQLADTWHWTGSRWIEQFPRHAPSPRASHSMVYDSTRGRVVLFGGKQAKQNYNDTWTYDGNDQRTVARSQKLR